MKLLDSSKWFLKTRLAPAGFDLIIENSEYLTDRGKQILKVYCLTNTPVEEIAEGLGLSGARVLQLATKAMRRLKLELSRYSEVLSNLETLRREKDLLEYKVRKLTEELTVLSKPILEISELDATAIEDMDFSVRTYNCLKGDKIHTLGDLRGRGHELIRIRNFGKKSLIEVEEVMDGFGIKWPTNK